MSKPKEEKPNSLPEFFEIVEKYQTGVGQSLWYRGCGRSSYQLLPSLYRHLKAKTPELLSDLERQLMTRFRQRSLPYLTRSLTDDWDTLFFMQHHGVPTRLLDWTENPLIALHFALMGAPATISANGNITFRESSAVWILDPIMWNRHALSHQSFDGGVLTPGDESLNGYKPTPTFSGMNKYPVALYGAHNSPRIVAQQGVFTIFGQHSIPMEEVYEQEGFPSECLLRITLKSQAIKGIRTSLLKHGITESVVFPDLEGLAREIKRIYGFEQ